MQPLYFLIYAWLVLGYTGAVMAMTEFLIFYKTIHEEDRPPNHEMIWATIKLIMKGPIAFVAAVRQVERTAAGIDVESDDE